MLHHGLKKVFEYVIAGMRMETEVSVEEVLQLYYALPLENSLENTEMTQMADLVDVECHGSCPSPVIHPGG